MQGVNFSLSEAQVNYNRRVSRLRVKVENSIGYLKNRFSILKRRNHYTPEKMSRILMACCVLHNFLRVNGEELEYGDLEQEGGDEREPISMEDSTTMNAAMRNVLV